MASPTRSHFDVLVVGGGTTGIIAAIAAADTGARTCLVESSGYLGGTTYALGNVITFHNNRMEQVVAGVPQKLVDKLAATGGVARCGHLPNPGGQCGTVTLMDPATLNIVALEMMHDAGVEVMLQTIATEVLATDRTLKGIEVFNKAGTQELHAQAIVDTSGDADVAVSAGVPYEKDQRGSRLTATSVFRIGNVDHDALIADLKKNPERVILLEDPYLAKTRGLTPHEVMARVESIYDLPFIYLSNIVRDYIPKSDWHNWGITGIEKRDWGALSPFGSRVHISPSAASPTIVFLNTTNVHVDATDPSELSRAEMEGQQQVKLMVELLRRYVPGFKDATLIGSNPKISVRASRRVAGEYRLSKDEVTLGARFPDSIAKGAYPMSVQVESAKSERLHLYVKDGGDYDIPYRCIVPKEIDGVLVAGRCMSADREASGSSRNGAQCMAVGHAAGVAAALSAQNRTTPRLLDPNELRAKLIEQGAIV